MTTDPLLERLRQTLGCDSIDDIEGEVARLRAHHPLTGQRFETPMVDRHKAPVVVTFLHMLQDGEHFVGQMDDGCILSPIPIMWTTTLPPLVTLPQLASSPQPADNTR